MKKSTFLKFYHVIILIILAFAINLILTAYGMLYLNNIYKKHILYLLALINTISFGFVIFVGIKMINISIKEIFPYKKLSLKLILLILLTCSGLVIIISEIDNIFQKFFPMNDMLFDFFMNLFRNNDIVGSILVLSIVAPITEELFFRGIIFRSFLQNYNLKFSIIVSSLLFGIIHFNPWQFIGAFLVGIYLAWIYYKTKNILLPILAHSFFNGLPIILTKFPLMEIEGLTKKSETFTMQPLWLDLTGIVFILIGIIFSYSTFKKEKNIESI